MIIETERLVLRPWREDDAANLYKYAKDPRVGPAAGWPVHESVENSLEILRAVLMNENTWAVCLKGSGEPVGSIGRFPSDCTQADSQPEIGYWIGVPHWGKGYIPEAAKALVSLCFEEGAATVWCGHFEGNEKSRRVIEKCGFTYRCAEPWQRPGDDKRNTLYYSIEREEWLK